MNQLSFCFDKKTKFRVIKRVKDGSFLAVDRDNKHIFTNIINQSFSSFIPCFMEKIKNALETKYNEKFNIEEYIL